VVRQNAKRYLDDIVEPTITDFENNPTSVRHAFLACVATFHTVDYIGRTVGKTVQAYKFFWQAEDNAAWLNSRPRPGNRRLSDETNCGFNEFSSVVIEIVALRV
jgi:hypothetical protein